MQDRSHIGERWRDERLRLGIAQADLAASVGASRRSVIDWEKGVAAPNAEALSAFGEVGADALYIITGRREQPLSRLDDRERLRLAVEAVEDGLAAVRRTLPPDKRAELILAAYDLMAAPEQAKGKVVELLRLVA